MFTLPFVRRHLFDPPPFFFPKQIHATFKPDPITGRIDGCSVETDCTLFGRGGRYVTAGSVCMAVIEKWGWCLHKNDACIICDVTLDFAFVFIITRNRMAEP